MYAFHFHIRDLIAVMEMQCGGVGGVMSGHRGPKSTNLMYFILPKDNVTLLIAEDSNCAINNKH